MKKERLLEIRKMMENFRCIKKEPKKRVFFLYTNSGSSLYFTKR